MDEPDELDELDQLDEVNGRWLWLLHSVGSVDAAQIHEQVGGRARGDALAFGQATVQFP